MAAKKKAKSMPRHAAQKKATSMKGYTKSSGPVMAALRKPSGKSAGKKVARKPTSGKLTAPKGFTKAKAPAGKSTAAISHKFKKRS